MSSLVSTRVSETHTLGGGVLLASLLRAVPTQVSLYQGECSADLFVGLSASLMQLC